MYACVMRERLRMVGVVWSGAVWSGLVRSGLVRSGLVCIFIPPFLEITVTSYRI